MILRMAQRANHLTENLMRSPAAKTEARHNEGIMTGSQTILGNESASPARLKHHDSGFRSLELSDFVSDGKKQFNINTTTSRPQKHDDNTIRFKKMNSRASGYNLVNGLPIEIVSTKNTHAK